MHNFITLNIDGQDFRVLDITGSSEFKGSNLILSTNILDNNRLEFYCHEFPEYSFIICKDEEELEKKIQEIFLNMSIIIGSDDE